MPNRNYQRSRDRENKVKAAFEKDGWFAMRTAGSHGVADVVAIRPIPDGTNPNYFEVKFVQIKVSENRVGEKVVPTICEVPFGTINVEFWKFPVMGAKWREKAKKRKEKVKKALSRSQSKSKE